MNVELPNQAYELLQKLAAEDEVTVDELLVRLVSAEDEDRHGAFVPGKGNGLFRCNRMKCFHPEPRPKNYRD